MTCLRKEKKHVDGAGLYYVSTAYPVVLIDEVFERFPPGV